MTRQLQTSRRRFLHRAGATLLAATGAARLLADEPADVPIVDEWIAQLAEEAPLGMQFRGTTPAECRRWQAEFSAKLKSLLGPHGPPQTWRTVVEDIADLEDHQRRQLVLVADGLAPLPVYLLIPKGQTDTPRPGILALHGHGSHGYDPVVGRDDLEGVTATIERANYDYGRQLVRRGYIVAAPCLMPFGRRLGNRENYAKQDPCGDTFVRMQLLGNVLMAEILRDCLWAFEFLARHEQVDATRMACVGLSFGGRMTMITAAFEPRVRVAVPSGSLNVMQERIAQHYSCGAQVIPGLLQYGDVPEIASLIAPRHLLWETGDSDGLIKSPWAEMALARMQRAYRAFNAEDRLMLDRFEGGHRWSGRIAFPLLKKVLNPPVG